MCVLARIRPILQPLKSSTTQRVRTMSGFSFAGAKNLEDILKLDLIEDKSKAEVSDIWLTYHEERERVHGDILSGKDGLKILDRAEKKYVPQY